MTIQPLELSDFETPVPDRKAEHYMLDLDVGKLAKRLVIFTPTGHAVDSLVAMARRDIPGIADAAAVQRVVSHNPDNLWAITRRDRYDSTSPVVEGFVAFLMLNEQGLRALSDGSLDRRAPDVSLLARQHERPAGIYTWAVYAPNGLVGAIPLILEKISAPLYADVDLFAWASTPNGKRLCEALGFRRGASLNGPLAPLLYQFARGPAPQIERPAYDSYVPGGKGHGGKELGVTIARSLEDLMRVVAIRGAVYIAEQDCPYDEEFDGNDLSATNLIGYIGDEPAGCIRVRYFSGFAKIERLAVRHEFRASKLAFRLVRAAIALAGAKGYARLYGHARKDLVRFWSLFGFRAVEGRAEFAFSDVAYVEMIRDAGPDPRAIGLDDDPYVLIRPEGRWHVPGVLERSAARGVAQS
ncbi:MAG TPA: GNAT family N-acetyltransferase [Rhizomicrobium sp.]|nr:GNAT family N-acetyltransferase [Rhizomicrobium sp.]